MRSRQGNHKRIFFLIQFLVIVLCLVLGLNPSISEAFFPLAPEYFSTFYDLFPKTKEESLHAIPIFSLTLDNEYLQYFQQVSSKSLAQDRLSYHRDKLFKAIWDNRNRTLIGYVESIHSKFPPLRAFPPPLLLFFFSSEGAIFRCG